MSQSNEPTGADVVGFLFVAAFIAFLGGLIGSAIGYNQGRNDTRNDAIVAEAGRWVGDKKSGEVKFVFGPAK